MSRFNYNPNSMFPKKPKRKGVDKDKVIRWALIVFLVVLIAWLSSGCKSMPYMTELDISITGVEIEFEPQTQKVDEGLFGNFQVITNRMQYAPTPVSFPLLMEMDKK
tara:strand:- start:5 stop:325 length:321 start_codon:yes stop_codon:yes gene_type:complete